ncbi:MAG: DUF1611 domain-containing protein [Cyanobacteriota bacterium]|nr:DUF1611 domain-containing protein [Cyanobacteriota bacterium]
MIQPESRIAILLHEGITGDSGKTGLALIRFGDFPVVAVIDYTCAGGSLAQLAGIDQSIPIVASVAEALTYQPQVLAIGIAPSGGALPEAWRQEVKVAVGQGLSIMNGLHTEMAQDPELQALLWPGQWIWDIRREPTGLSVGTARARLLPCRRVLTVGTDMSVGKMSASLQLHQAARQRGLKSKFLATGQTGIMLSGEGIPLDAIRVDFAAGAVEQLVMRYGYDHDILQIEGQGSLLNPASTATLPLLRGCQPTHLILVHRVGQTTIKRMEYVPIPPLPEVIALYESLARAAGAFAPAAVVGIALNTHHLDPAAADIAIAKVEEETGIPCTDVVRFGGDRLLDAILAI